MSNEITTTAGREVSVNMTTASGFELAQRIAKALQTSSLVPDQFRGNLGDCLLGLNMAQRMNADPLQVLQNLHIIHGKPGLSASFLIGRFNTSGQYEPISYQFGGEGEDYGCVAVTTYLPTGREIIGPIVTLGMARKEGWTTKKGSKWQSMPELMLRYRAAAFLIRTTAPELALGMHTVEELHDSNEQDTVGTVTPTLDLSQAINGSQSAAQPVEAVEAQGVAEVMEPAASAATEAPDASAIEVEEQPDLRGAFNAEERWYGQVVDNEGEIVWTDVNNTRFDDSYHGWSAANKSPAYTKQGIFRARRTVNKPAEEQPADVVEAKEQSAEVRSGIDLSAIENAQTLEQLHAAWEAIAEDVRTGEEVMNAYNAAESRINEGEDL